MKHLRIVIYAVFLLIFIAILGFFVDFSKAFVFIFSADYKFLIFAVSLSVVFSFFSTWRLKVLLSVIGDIPFWYLWGLGYVGAFISIIFPFSAGGFIVTYILSKKLQVSYIKLFSLLFIDFLLNYVINIILAPFAAWYFLQKHLISIAPNEGEIIFLSAGILITCVVFFLVKSKIHAFVLKAKVYIASIKKIFSKKREFVYLSFRLFLLTVCIGGIGVLQNYSFYLAFNLAPPIIDFILANSIFVLTTLLPGIPLRLGQYETFGVLTLPYLLKLDSTAVFATLATSHFLSYAISSVLGIFSLYYLKIDLRLYKKMIAKKENEEN